MLNICLLTDLHLGNPRNAAQYMRQNMIDHFYPQLNQDTDILFIGGDFFHTLLSLNSAAGHIAVTIINELIFLSMEYDFLIRVVRGTYSHDRDQLRLFLSAQLDDPDRVKVVDTISIEYISKHDINVLYIPDDLPSTDGIGLVKGCLKANQCKQVDFILGHGYFKHMLPFNIPHEPPNVFTHAMFKDIVKGAVMFGHVHTSSVYKNIIGGGSFDRITHGEEEAKGFFTLKYDKSQEHNKISYQFHENSSAAIFKTIDFTASKYNSGQVFEILHHRLSELVNGYTGTNIINLRIVIDDPVLSQSIKMFVRDEYKNIRISSIKSKHLVNAPIEEVALELSDLPILTQQNLAEMVYNHLQMEGVEITQPVISKIIGR